MTGNNMGICMLVGIMLLIGIGLIWGHYHIRNHTQKLMDYYNDIKIGDRFSFSVGPLHPFDKSRTHTAEIINKTLAGGQYPWVQYRYDDGSVAQSELHDFLTNHTKITA